MRYLAIEEVLMWTCFENKPPRMSQQNPLQLKLPQKVRNRYPRRADCFGQFLLGYLQINQPSSVNVTTREKPHSLRAQPFLGDPSLRVEVFEL
jgi:hypothetical protein